MDQFAQFKEGQKEVWAGFAVMEAITGSVAPKLVEFAGVQSGSKVLDVGCGTGVVAITAARRGASVTGLDLTPELIERARENAMLAGVDAEWRVGDVEDLPFQDGNFDLVLSQFGHMFAPRPDLATHEMLRVLRPGGTIAFSTWPPDEFVGLMFTLRSKFLPPPDGVAAPSTWGDRGVVEERLGDMVGSLQFRDGEMMAPTLSPKHSLGFMGQGLGPISSAFEILASDPDRLSQFRSELEGLIGQFFEDNILHQRFLMTRAVKK